MYTHGIQLKYILHTRCFYEIYSLPAQDTKASIVSVHGHLTFIQREREAIADILYIRNKKRPRKEPWGAPHLRSSVLEQTPLSLHSCFLLVR